MLESYLPSYYKHSAVTHDLLQALETELERLKQETEICENTFFILLADKYIDRHLEDLELDDSGDLQAKRSRILARLRGLGTINKPQLEKIIDSYAYGSVRVTEFPGQYLIKIKFINQKGRPANMEEIMAVVDEVKPAHLAAEYVFTYRIWREVLDYLEVWDNVKGQTWDFVRCFDVDMNYLQIDDGGNVYFCPDGDGNARSEWLNGRPYAVRMED